MPLDERRCRCGTIISRYNKGDLCAPCQRAATDELLNAEQPLPKPIGRPPMLGPPKPRQPRRPPRPKFGPPKSLMRRYRAPRIPPLPPHPRLPGKILVRRPPTNGPLCSVCDRGRHTKPTHGFSTCACRAPLCSCGYNIETA